MNLVVDIGNSRTKAAVLDRGKIVERWTLPDPGKRDMETIIAKHPAIDRCILSDSGEGMSPVAEVLRERIPLFVQMGEGVATPLKNLYRTPGTLGPDRLAAGVGANLLYPGENLMIADLGTAITIDFVSAAGEFLGGSISPGARLRFRALHEYTGRLPMGTLEDSQPGIPGTTAEAVASGVAEGIRHEIEGWRTEFAAAMPGLKLILTGGDAEFFVKRFKNTIFANYDLVVIGLNRILNYNAPEQENS